MVLEEAQRRGLVGSGPVATHVQRAIDTSSCVARPPHRMLDLGSGGGLPGLPLALLWPAAQVVLLDGSLTRARFLEETVEALELSSRVSVLDVRAEVAGRGDMRGTFDLVVARSFGSPAVTAECAAPLLSVGGRLVVAEPPGGRPDRWDPAGLDLLGLRATATITEPSAFQIMEQTRACPDRFPRRTGIPAKRPLF
ncbi:MAG: class I SAM-dependent methyltransferase [Acidimicrobiales bacterium]|nr:class I SAM-dependent methyltransferase [Acidimicrobiales bacterium]